MTRRSSSALRSWSVLALLALFGSACGGDDAPAEEPSTTRQPATSVPATSVPATSVPATTIAGQGTLAEGPVIVDSAQVVPGADPALEVSGQLPTACHTPSFEVDRTGGGITVRLVSLSDPAVMCSQAIEPFTLSIPLGAPPASPSPVTLNGEQVGTLG